MDAVKAVQDYVTKMVQPVGMKALLLDDETMSILSMAFSQSEILQKDVFLFERITNPREPMHHLTAICFLRPTQASIDALATELRHPKYGHYYIYFSNVLKPTMLEKLAEADEHELVVEIQEYFPDYLAVNRWLINFNLKSVLDQSAAWDSLVLDRVKLGLGALCLSLRKRPMIRFQKTSEVCQRLAKATADFMSAERSLFDFRQTSDVPPILLIIDRRYDPVTPLLNQWTYQSMVHELLGVVNNRVDLSKVPNINKDLREIVINADQDAFFQQNMFLNFGEIGDNIRQLVNKFQQTTKSHEHLDTIADMKKFVENYPAFKAMSGTVSKHVAVVGELSRLVEAQHLLEVSEVEQELACQDNHTEVLGKLRSLLVHVKVKDTDKLRLVLLYMLRYEKQDSVLRELLDTLEQQGVQGIEIVSAMRRYAGAGCASRCKELFGERTAVGRLKRLVGGVKGVENIYTQHAPVLSTILDQMSKGKLPEAVFPFVNDQGGPERFQDVIVFFVGGCTYEESRAVELFNQANPGMRVLLGGTSIQNFSSFREDVLFAASKNR
eukprot:m.122115 g.122115  ORF g.122115 m.122115 type:complete len:553 (+) comp16218_c0_seq1:187-1845(+)